MRVDEFLETPEKLELADLFEDEKRHWIKTLWIDHTSPKPSLCFDSGEKVLIEDLGDLVIGV